jgi:hypothetical protein
VAALGAVWFFSGDGGHRLQDDPPGRRLAPLGLVERQEVVELTELPSLSTNCVESIGTIFFLFLFLFMAAVIGPP